jgi:cobalamin biosynthetic protein CobC
MDGGFAATPLDTLARHGGQLSAARSLFPEAPRPWIDLSTGINPHPYRASGRAAADRARLPDPSRLLELQAIAARVFGVSEPQRVVPTPGTELALRLLPTVIGGSTVAIATPTYSSHADAWRLAGGRVSEMPANAIDPSTPHDVVVIVNPNNPDGALQTRARLLTLHDALLDRGGWLVIDEAFMDTDPANSICDLAGTVRAPNLVALRSFGKFYGLAGVRLGFVIGSALIAQRLRGLIGDWPLSADALAAGIAAYADHDWGDRMRAQLQDEAQQLDALLTQHGLTIVGGTSLFRLAQHHEAPGLLQQLLRAGILARPFAHERSWLRFGLPGSSLAWRRLATALSAS